MSLRVFLAGVLCAAAVAQEPQDLEKRVEQLERELREQRARGDSREKRLAELEDALRQATEALAHSQDRRGLEDEIAAYLEEHAPALPPPEPSRLAIGAVVVASYRFSDLEGTDANTFLLDDAYLRFVYRFSEQVTARYYTNGVLAEVEFHQSDLLQFNAGRVVVPFGQFNPRSFPDTFDTLSRPLLYPGDEEIQGPENSPSGVFRSTYSDTGVVVSGSRWWDRRQLYYAAFVTNGLVGTSDLGQSASFRDNNDDKQFGARLAGLLGLFESTRFGLGASWMTGKYDDGDSLSYRMYGIDFVLVIDGLFRGGEGSLTVRAEYVYAPREILVPTVGDPTLFLNSENKTEGAYLLVEARIDARWMVYAQGDWLAQRAPLLANGAVDPADAGLAYSQTWRAAIGVVYKFRIGIVWKLEYSYWDFDRGAPDASVVATQVVVPF